ncbi:MAG: ABC transporter ATP-binding protein [candidate division NC10 bacterium]|nr:ABC transporter ATP-binding protein [candidate division NC10 bacterium]
MDSPAIVAKDLSKDFRVGFALRRRRILHHLDLEVKRGEIFGYLGPNGAGKTTTIKLLMGLIFPTSGQISLLGGEINDFEVKSRIGFVPENPYFYDHLTGWEFMEYCGHLLGMDKAMRDRRISEWMDRLGIRDAGHTRLRKYSKGMIQRIGLAQALLNHPDLVILDEPMSGLDPIGRKEIRDLILSLKEEGKTVFFSSHILPDVEMICDRVGILVDGHLREVGVLEEMLEAKIESIEVTVREADLKRLSHLPLSSPPLQRGGKVLLSVPNEEILQETLSRLKEEEVRIVSIVPQRETLEEYFLREVGTSSG